jgi:hypothetical protein
MALKIEFSAESIGRPHLPPQYFIIRPTPLQVVADTYIPLS